MEVLEIIFCHRGWWLRRRVWWFAGKIAGIWNGFQNLHACFEIHIREMTGVNSISKSHG